MNQLSRLETVQSPLIPVIGELIRQNEGTISLGQGVVSYPPPEEAIKAITEFLQNTDNHKYQAVEGIPSLITAIKTKLATENQIQIEANNCVVVTAGSNMAFVNAILAITVAGDEIILNAPYYFNHEMAIRMIDCTPVIVPTNKDYQLQPELIAQAITAKTKAVVTISPNNPTGTVYSQASLAQVNQLCRDKGIYHISDEAYEYFTYDRVKHISPGSFPNSNNHTISLFSLSKAYGFASWRIGYMVIPQHLLMSVKKVQDTNLICPPVISQYAAKAALKVGYSYCQPHLQEIAQVRKIVLTKLQTLNNICTVNQAEGAFYFFLKVNSDLNDFELVKKLITDYRVAVIPGSTFGMDSGCYLRVAYGALQIDTAEEGITRLIKGVTNLLG